MQASLTKRSSDVYENPESRPRFNSGDLVSYMRQEATYITSMPGGKSLINMIGTRHTDFKEVDENNLRMIEPRHMRRTHRGLDQPAMSEPVVRDTAPRFDTALEQRPPPRRQVPPLRVVEQLL